MTLEEIGRRAQVSRSTVSRVVNDQYGVSAAARQRVQDVIAETGFSPNRAARSLASRRTGVVGLVIPSHVHNLFADPYYAMLIQGISRASNAAGTTLSLFIFESEAEESEVYPRVVAPGFVDGVILTASRRDDPLAQRLQESGIPWVMVGRPEAAGISYVDADNFGGARDAAIHLGNLGYQRIAFIGAPAATTVGLDRLRGFKEGLTACGLRLDDELYTSGDFSELSGYQAIRRLIPSQPEAVFVASDTMALGVLRALNEAQLSVPQDIALASFDGFASSRMAIPALTTVRQLVPAAGTRAMEILLSLISGEISSPVNDVLPTELIVRDSCGASRIGSGHGEP